MDISIPTIPSQLEDAMKKLPLAAALTCLATLAQAETPVLTVLTYDSFASEWGPGPAVKKGFEESCACEVRYVTAGDGAALLSRVQMEGAHSEADVVVGLDTNLTAAATATGLFAPHGQPAVTALPVAYDDPLFLPFDWGWFAFVYDKTKLSTPPASLQALADSGVKVIIEDPRSSTPGLGLVMWVKAAYGDKAGDLWKGLADNIVTVTPGWSEAYGMFLEGEADMVLSYTTSPAYHLIAESDDTKAAAAFDEGHYLQVEVAGMLASSAQPALAQAYLAYLVSDAGQAAIPETNWMYPANTPAAGLPKGFETLIRPAKSLLFPADEAGALRDAAVAEWQAALAR
jgi:thiamine transport system substrate-binding protein